MANALEAAGLSVWWDTVLRTGQTYDEVTEGQLREATVVVVLWSSRSVRSKWVRAEATLGDRKSALVPVMIEPCDRPIMFELTQTADLTKWHGDVEDPNWQNFLGDVRTYIDRRRENAAPKATTVAPATDATAPAKEEARDDTIEAAFWMSIQHGDDLSDYEDYLERYPHGNFAKLAHKRLKAIEEKAHPSAPVELKAEPAAPPPVKPAPPVATPEPQRKGGSVMTWLAAAIVLAAAGAGAFLYMSGNADMPATTQANATPPLPPVETPLAPTADTTAQPAATNPTSDVPTEPASEPAAPAPQPEPPAPPANAPFRDCDRCPEMKPIPGGDFTIGSPTDEPGRSPWEGPLLIRHIAPFTMSTREVTFSEWEACVADNGCNRYQPDDRGWGKVEQPVLMVSWNDASAFVRWLGKHTGKAYRLPSESEWEYAARGGTTTAYWWGGSFDAALVARGRATASGQRSPNPFGLYDVTGNVAEWVADCYVNGYEDGAEDGTARDHGDCRRRVVRGGSWRDKPRDLRVASRTRVGINTRDGSIGFRVARAP